MPRAFGANPALPAPPSLPVFRSTDDAVAYGRTQAAAFAKPEMQKLVSQGRVALSSSLGVTVPTGLPMTGDDAEAWVRTYISGQGFPDTPAKAQQFAEGFVRQQTAKVGVPPEAIAAADLVLHMPTTPEEGAAWAVSMGKGYAEKFGIPLSTDGLASCAARAAAANFGVDPNIVDLGMSIVADGRLSPSDAETLAVSAAAYAGAAAFSAIGIPAPIGAMIGSFVGQAVIGVVKNLFGPDDLDVQEQAYAQAVARRNARMAECERLGSNAWQAYNRYWDDVLYSIQRLVERPDMNAPLLRGGGVRAYGVTYDPSDPVFRHFCLLPNASNIPNPDGCLYYCKSLWDPAKNAYTTACDDYQCDRTYKPGDSFDNTKYCTAAGAPVVLMRSSYADWHVDIRSLFQAVPMESGGKVSGKLDARAMLHYWFADRLTGFPAAGGGATDADRINSAAFVPMPWVKSSPGDCTMEGSMKVIQDNLRTLDRAASYVMADIVHTVAWQTALDAAQRSKQEADAAALVARHAQLNALRSYYQPQLKTKDEQRALVDCLAKLPSPSAAGGAACFTLAKTAGLSLAQQAAAAAAARRRAILFRRLFWVACAAGVVGVYVHHRRTKSA